MCGPSWRQRGTCRRLMAAVSLLLARRRHALDFETNDMNSVPWSAQLIGGRAYWQALDASADAQYDENDNPIANAKDRKTCGHVFPIPLSIDIDRFAPFLRPSPLPFVFVGASPSSLLSARGGAAALA